MEKRKIALAVGAHPDDVEIICSGTMALLGEAGWELHIATLSLGDYGSDEYSPQEIRKIRRAEAERACERLDASYHYVGLHDFGIFHDDRTNRMVTALLRNVNPEIVITHPPVDYMTDHEITSRLVRNACFYAAVPNFDTLSLSPVERIAGVPWLYYAHPIEGTDLFGEPVVPAFYVDITDLIERKAELLACHSSQREWLRAHHGMDEYLEIMRRWAAEQGKGASEAAGRTIQYAEAFRQHRGHAYPKENFLSQILGDRVIPNE